MLTKEAYKKLNQNKDGIKFIRPFSEYTLKEVFESLTEFEELKRDLKRYFELLESNVSYVFLGTQDISDEFDELEDKLSKVGK